MIMDNGLFKLANLIFKFVPADCSVAIMPEKVREVVPPTVEIDGEVVVNAAPFREVENDGEEVKDN